MPGNYKKRQEKITFDALVQTVNAEFAKISDQRRANATYKLTDFLRSTFAMFSLKTPSLLSFDERTKVESRNLKSIYQIEAIPSDTQMRAALDPVEPAPLRQLFRTLFETLQTAGVIQAYHFWRDYVLVTVDGVEHFASRKIHCKQCSTRTLRDGTTEYFHAGLGAVLVNPAHEEVLPLDFEPILKQNGAKKNDCERNAAKRLCAARRERYPDLKIILVEDALYANAPHLRQIIEYGWRFILNVKPDSGEATRWTPRDGTGAGMELHGRARRQT